MTLMGKKKKTPPKKIKMKNKNHPVQLTQKKH